MISRVDLFGALAFVVCCLTLGVSGAPEEDRVLFLPGLEVQPTFNHYAGFLNASGTKHFFYWYFRYSFLCFALSQWRNEGQERGRLAGVGGKGGAK